MTPIIEREIHALLADRPSVDAILPEIPAAIGIADLVAASFDKEVMARRLSSGLAPITSPMKIMAMDLLQSGRWRSIDVVARKIGSKPQTVFASTIEPLLDAGLVELQGTRVRSTGLWHPLALELTAFELKLSKWKSALRQADNFAVSADRSWVVLDATQARSAGRNRDWFRDAGVGLASIDPEGTVRTLNRPRRRRPIRWLKSLMAERAFAAAGMQLV